MRKNNSNSWFYLYILFIYFCLLLIYFGWKQTNKIAIEYINYSVDSIEESNIENEIHVDCVELIEAETEIETEFHPAFELSDYERWVVCCMVAGESAGESYDGQWAVTQCIYQACMNDNLQPSEVKIQYQYSGWNETLEFDNPELWAQIEEIVSRVFDYGEMCVDDEILWFYAPYWMKNGVSEWHETQRFVTQIGGHKFFAEW